ncbi:hypothetical protein [Streptomyces sp. NPDC006527]|uniref:hypothetical protein n=1 Tax=Streptomyces sp. NPDC006527 TaxID=3364749 RepID=UPI00369432BC
MPVGVVAAMGPAHGQRLDAAYLRLKENSLAHRVTAESHRRTTFAWPSDPAACAWEGAVRPYVAVFGVSLVVVENRTISTSAQERVESEA